MIYPKNRSISRTRAGELQPVRFGQLRPGLLWPPCVVLDPNWDEDFDLPLLLEAVRQGKTFDGTLITEKTKYDDHDTIPHINDAAIHANRRSIRAYVSRQDWLQQEWERKEWERQRQREETADWVPIPDLEPHRKLEWSAPWVEEVFWKYQSELLFLIGPCPRLVLEGWR